MPPWISSIFNPACITTIISCLSPRRITPAMIEFLNELQSKGCIEEKHLEMLHVHLRVLEFIIDSIKLVSFGA
jgi:hypothetical protein